MEEYEIGKGVEMEEYEIRKGVEMEEYEIGKGVEMEEYESTTGNMKHESTTGNMKCESTTGSDTREQIPGEPEIFLQNFSSAVWLSSQVTFYCFPSLSQALNTFPISLNTLPPSSIHSLPFYIPLYYHPPFIFVIIFYSTPMYSDQGPQKIIIISRPPSFLDFVPFIITLSMYAMIAQTVLLIVKKISKSVYNGIILALILLFPFLIFKITGSLFLILIESIIFFITGFCIKKVTTRPFVPDSPKLIYFIFKSLFFFTNISIFLSQSIAILTFLSSSRYFPYALLLMLASIYSGVLCKEIFMNLSHFIAKTTGYFSKEGVPTIKNNDSVCMICTESLKSLKSNSKIEDFIYGDYFTVTLDCGHNYHNECIKGWCMIGQNNFCPYCKKGVDMKMFSSGIWSKTENAFRPIMNFVRSLTVFFIVIFCYVLYRTYLRL